MDHAMQDRKPGAAKVALMDLGQAIASLEDRLNIHRERLSDITFSPPRPSGERDDERAAEVNSPLANELRAMTTRIQRLESFIVTLDQEIEL
jgi:hypothetical protein